MSALPQTNSNPAIIRVKRHINEEPLDAFVLNCKRRKTDNEPGAAGTSESSTILKFAGTVNESTDVMNLQHITKLSKDEAKDLLMRKRSPESNLRQRVEENKEKSQNNRFKIVNFTRALENADESEEHNKSLTIVDVEKERVQEQEPATTSAASTSAAASSSEPDPYVYDLYVSEANTVLSYPQDIDDMRVLHFDGFMFDQHRLVNEAEFDSDDNKDDNESEDSNEENNWRNDYPEEEDGIENPCDGSRSDGEDSILDAINNFETEFGDMELSTTDEYDEDDNQDRNVRNGFVYSIDSDAIGFEDDLDYCDVNRYGEHYARYTARIQREINEESDLSSYSGLDSSNEEENDFDNTENCYGD